MILELNALETARFGIVAAKVIDSKASVAAIDAEAKSKGVQMLTIRIDVGDLPRVHALESAGFQLMDTLVYYSRHLKELPPDRQLSDGVTLRLAVPEDAMAVANIAKAGFEGYFGHYHADPRLDRSASDAAYVEWAETSTKRVSSAAPVLLANVAGTVAGFITLRRNSDLEFEIVLSAVDPNHQSKGLYSALFSKSLSISRDAGADRCTTSTQVNNYAVQRVWSRLGFFPSQGYYTFHKWYA